MLSPDIYYFENSVHPDQLASEKPADQDPHFFSTLQLQRCTPCPMVGIYVRGYIRNSICNPESLGRSVVNKIFSMIRFEGWMKGIDLSVSNTLSKTKINSIICFVHC